MISRVKLTAVPRPRLSKFMAAQQSYAAAAGAAAVNAPQHHQQFHARTPSPRAHRLPEHTPPRQTSPDETTYVLTLQTDKNLHDRMTGLRSRYFPKHINKLDAHLTLFNALPESHLDPDVIPLLETIANRTQAFPIKATRPFRLNKGIAISLSVDSVDLAKTLHDSLRETWKEVGFLSQQDSGGRHLHYTVMNKVDDEEKIASALDELQNSFRPILGTAVGLTLWRYDRGWWRWVKSFEFAKSEVQPTPQSDGAR